MTSPVWNMHFQISGSSRNFEKEDGGPGLDKNSLAGQAILRDNLLADGWECIQKTVQLFASVRMRTSHQTKAGDIRPVSDPLGD